MKVNVSNTRTASKNKFDLTHQVSSTFDFGFVTPLMVDEIEPNSTINLRIGQVVRLQPMVKPTFGQIQYKTYNNYVKMEDLYHPFPNMLANQTYSGYGASYIPWTVPSIAVSFLYACLISNGTFACIPYTAVSTTQTYLETLTVASTAASTSSTDIVNATSVMASACSIWSNSLISFSTTNNHQKYDGDLEYGSADWAYVDTTNSLLIYGRYGQWSKNLLKVLIGCGYEINTNTDTYVSLMPLFAYYKTWFDLFIPAREMTWTETNAYAFLESVEQSNNADYDDWTANATAAPYLQSFINDLTRCYYTQNVDFAAAHIDGQTNVIAGDLEFDYVDSYNKSKTVTGYATSTEGAVVGGTIGTTSYPLNQRALDILKVMDKRINTASVIGGRLSLLLKSIYGSAYDNHDSEFIGSQIVDCNIQDVMSTAETTEGYLGEYAGKGIGSDSGKTFKFSSNRGTGFGYVVSIAAIVPTSRMSQGMDMQLKHLGVFDFYNKDFDSVTLLPTPKKFIYGSEDLILSNGDNTAFDAGFGNVPNYIEYKCKKNIMNGDMRMMSTRQSYLPFNIDKLLPYGYMSEDSSGTTIYLNNMDLAQVVCGTKWRYIGLYDFIGWYNRIFVNSGNAGEFHNYYDSQTQEYVYERYFRQERLDDNFIVHNYFDYTKLSTAVPIADSWLTEAYGDHLKIEEA